MSFTCNPINYCCLFMNKAEFYRTKSVTVISWSLWFCKLIQLTGFFLPKQCWADKNMDQILSWFSVKESCINSLIRHSCAPVFPSFGVGLLIYERAAPSPLGQWARESVWFFLKKSSIHSKMNQCILVQKCNFAIALSISYTSEGQIQVMG